MKKNNNSWDWALLNIPLHGYQRTVNGRLVPFPKPVELPPSWYRINGFALKNGPQSQNPPTKTIHVITPKSGPTDKERVGCLTFGYGKDNPCKRRLFVYFCLHQIITTTILHRSTPQQQHWQSKIKNLTNTYNKDKEKECEWNKKWKRTLKLSSSLALLTHLYHFLLLLSSLLP